MTVDDAANTVATEDHTFPLTEGELAWLIRQGVVVDVDFGPGRVWLTWEKGEKMPETVRLIAQKRGVFTEGIDGDGI